MRAGFEPAANSFADCPLKPLEYRIVAGIAGFEPTVPVSKTGALTLWLYPIIMVIRAGLEPRITALKGLRPDLLDERTVWGRKLPVLVDGSYQNVIDEHIEKRRKNDQIIYSWKRCSALPFVNRLRGIKTKDRLQVMDRKACILPQLYNVGTGQCQINGWDIHLKHLLLNDLHAKSRLSHIRQAASIIPRGDCPRGVNPNMTICLS